MVVLLLGFQHHVSNGIILHLHPLTGDFPRTSARKLSCAEKKRTSWVFFASDLLMKFQDGRFLSSNFSNFFSTFLRHFLPFCILFFVFCWNPLPWPQPVRSGVPARPGTETSRAARAAKDASNISFFSGNVVQKDSSSTQKSWIGHEMSWNVMKCHESPISSNISMIIDQQAIIYLFW